MNLGFTLAVDGYWGVAALALLTPFGAKALMALLRKGPPRA